MLVLTRRAEEKIKIGDNIIVNILSVDGSVVKIGIDAPKEVTILRMEVLDQIKSENIEAAMGVKDIANAVDLFKKKMSKELKE